MLLEIVLLSLCTTKVTSQCKWTDPETGFILDLTPLSKVTLKTTDNDILFSTTNDIFSTTDIDVIHEYIYSPCRNAVRCEGRAVMVNQTDINDPYNDCHVIGSYDAKISPTYTRSDGIDMWTFQYTNGDTDCGNPARTWSPTFVCDKNTNAEISYVLEIPGSCYYSVEIMTKYACPNKTNSTTLPPQNKCIWREGDYTLNLTVLEGHIMTKISENNPSQIYSVSPCGNNVKCKGENAMSTVGTSTSNCLQSIAKWDEGLTEPKYSSNFGGQWEFVYTNGDQCNEEPESIVSVIWNCNQLAGTGVIKAAEQKGECMFEIQIDSNLACGTNPNRYLFGDKYSI